MKKLLQILAIPLAALAFVSVGAASVSAQETCRNVVISNTGPGSVNTVECEEERYINITCANSTDVIVIDLQNAQSGDGSSTGNTNGGDVSTGDAMNQSEVDAAIASACGTADSETPEEETEEPEEEEESEEEVLAAQTLPNTGSTSPLQTVAVIAGFAVALLAAARVGSNLYTRNQN